jgi:hypothetical protein
MPRLVDFMPLMDMTKPTMAMGRPNNGIIQARRPTIHKISPAVALPVGLLAGIGGGGV